MRCESAAMQRHSSGAQSASLTFAAGATHAWNMLNASFHTPVPPQPCVAA